MAAVVVAGADAGAHESGRVSSGRIPRTPEEAYGYRRYWDRFYGYPQESLKVTLDELALFTRHVRPEIGETAVDVGCGRGSFTAAMAQTGLSVSGYDWSNVAVLVADLVQAGRRLTFGVHDFLGDGAPAGVKPGEVDVLSCRLSLQYLKKEEFLARAVQWLRPDTGRLYVVLPVNERQPPAHNLSGYPDAEVERLRADWEHSVRWDLDPKGAFTAMVLQGPRFG